MVDADCGMIGMEWIDGWSVREVLGGGAEGEEEPSDYNNDGNAEEDEARVLTPVEEAKKKRREEAESVLAVLNVSVSDLMSSIGHLLAKMHLANIVHGDLTTSNMMLRPLTVDPGTESKPYEIVLIDFGLASASNVAENLAVDLYVLERAFGSTHPASEQWFDGVSTKLYGGVETGEVDDLFTDIASLC
jgi:TP53 regulating kinase-like protein